MANVKQVIVMRHDLGMRRGKQIAQGAHASIAFLSEMLRQSGSVSFDDLSPAERSWIEGPFAKVCVRVDSEAELMDVYERAKSAGLRVHLITDSGRTEFHGQPTATCLAIGPDVAEKVDEITGELKLL